jgi:hypothetical protein
LQIFHSYAISRIAMMIGVYCHCNPLQSFACHGSMFVPYTTTGKDL